MKPEKTKILSRFYLFSIPLLCAGLAIWLQMIYISVFRGDSYRKLAESRVIRHAIVPGNRGNIYTEGGDLMAVTLAEYDIRIDLKAVPKDIFNRNYKALADSLATLPHSQPAAYYSRLLRINRRKGNRYLLLKRNLTYPDYMRARAFPILNRGRFKGGMIAVRKLARVNPMGALAARTIGFDDYRGHVGIAGAYGYYLRGRDGRRLEQRIAGGRWKPVGDADEVEPRDGADVVTTIDLDIQNLAHQALLETLRQFRADHGCVVVMEVKTGEVKAIVNLGKGADGSFYEKRNYAVFEASEPGSLFKLVSLMAALEDRVIDTTTQVDTQGGVMRYYDDYIRDTRLGGYGVISAKRVFEVSSNIGMAKLILKSYEDHPEKFVNRLYKWRLNEKLHLAIPGEGQPRIPHPNDPTWSGIALPWMAYGYGLQLTPLQILGFYNAVANNGEMVKPRFVKEILRGRKVEKVFKPEIVNPAICSKETLGKVQDMLKGVFVSGTAENLRSDSFTMAGKTGTVQVEYWQKGQPLQYRASLCGYFPAENPQYSCIVVVHKPQIGYYGAQVAGPVFKRIAHYCYVHTPKVEPESRRTGVASRRITEKTSAHRELAAHLDKMPNLLGAPGMQVVSQLENVGLKVTYRGVGKVVGQHPKAGAPISSHSPIRLRLQW